MKDRRSAYIEGKGETCETCKHWWQISADNYDKGFCHRYPPTVAFYENVAPKFPITYRYMFCGEWLANDDYIRELFKTTDSMLTRIVYTKKEG